MNSSLLTAMEANLRHLSKGHKKIAAYISENYDKAAFMTAAALGNKVDWTKRSAFSVWRFPNP